MLLTNLVERTPGNQWDTLKGNNRKGPGRESRNCWHMSSNRNLLGSLPRREAAFIEPMECLAVSKLPEGAEWVWEIKLDGYRAIAVRSGGAVALFSRRKKSLSKKFPYIVEALAGLPAETVVDGELVALDDSGRPEFNLLQNFRGAASRIHYYIFDLLWETVSGAKTPRLARAPRIRWDSDRLRVGVEAPGHTPSGM
jgi:ATP-dependent DNA ligase